MFLELNSVYMVLLRSGSSEKEAALMYQNIDDTENHPTSWIFYSMKVSTFSSKNTDCICFSSLAAAGSSTLRGKYLEQREQRWKQMPDPQQRGTDSKRKSQHSRNSSIKFAARKILSVICASKHLAYI